MTLQYKDYVVGSPVSQPEVSSILANIGARGNSAMLCPRG